MPTSVQQMAAIERSLGELTGGVNSILREIDSLKSERREDVQSAAERMEHIEGNVTIVGKIAEQARNIADNGTKEIVDIKKVIYEEIKPQTDNIKRIALKGTGFLAALAFLGGALANPTIGAVGSALDKFLK